MSIVVELDGIEVVVVVVVGAAVDVVVGVVDVVCGVVVAGTLVVVVAGTAVVAAASVVEVLAVESSESDEQATAPVTTASRTMNGRVFMAGWVMAPTAELASASL